MRGQVLQSIRDRRLFKPGDRVGVAVSGGADSVALLRWLLEFREQLGIVLVVAHYNHQLRGAESDADQGFVAELAQQHNLPFFAGRGDVRLHAETQHQSLEHAARVLRYAWFHDLARQQRLNIVATAHTNDDQAETVLMKFLRGAGTRGLAGIHPVLEMDGWRMVRPFLQITRPQIESYLNEIQQSWREDRTNRDTQHLRNRIRHELLPLLERDFNPSLRKVLSETSDVARAEQDFWVPIVAEELSARVVTPRVLQLAGFEKYPIALQRRLLKDFLERESFPPDFHFVEDLRRCVLGEIPAVNLPNGWVAARHSDQLQLVSPRSAGSAGSFEYPLAVPGERTLLEIGLTLSAVVIPATDAVTFDPPGSLLDRNRISTTLTLRNWQPGDRFRPAFTGSEEKLKRLFAEKKIPAERRSLWPVAVNQAGQIVWVQDFPAGHDFAWFPGGGDAIRIDVFAGDGEKPAF